MFGVDWTKGGEGQEILREHIRASSLLKVTWRGKQYQGVLKMEWEMNTNNGRVILEVRP